MDEESWIDRTVSLLGLRRPWTAVAEASAIVRDLAERSPGGELHGSMHLELRWRHIADPAYP